MKKKKHYGKNFLCRATICTAKGLICTAKTLPCVAARQRPHGKAIDGKGFFAVRLANVARQRSLPCDAARQRLLLCRVLNMVYLKKSFKLISLGFEPRTQSRESVQPCH
jgi:hypothetical protein